MDMFRLGLTPGVAILAVLACAATCLALTVDVDVTPDYVREHSKLISVEVTERDDGLIQFKIVHAVSTPMYHVAHLEIVHQGKVIAKSDTPSYGHTQGNTFYVALSPNDIAASKFEISDSAVAGKGDDAAPVPGTINHRIHLIEFVPIKMLKKSGIKD